MNITFYFDPTCPFCWITSRWLLQVSGKRDINITWKPFSLALKNNSFDKDSDSPHRDSHIASHRLLRVMVAAEAEHRASLIDMYTTAGIKIHIVGDDVNDELIGDVLAERKLPTSLLKAADDKKYDDKLDSLIKSATDIAGDDIGVPTIVFTNEKGEQQGFFGPVLQELPELEQSLELWDGLSKLATNSSFYELKRSRPDSMPDVVSTAKC